MSHEASDPSLFPRGDGHFLAVQSQLLAVFDDFIYGLTGTRILTHIKLLNFEYIDNTGSG